VERTRAERDNLAQALRQGLEQADGGTVAATSAVLAGLWIVESNYPRLTAVATETARLLSHFRPGPDLVEVTRTTLTMFTTFAFLLQGPRPARSLVALRRLPPAPPDTMIRAIGIVLGVAPGDRSALYELCDSDEPLVAAAANGIVSYFWENESDLERALEAARRTLRAVEAHKFPYLQAVANARIAELCLQAERGDEARRHLLAVLPVLERLGTAAEVVGIQWWMVLANLQLGDIDEAEHWLERTAPPRADEPVGTRTYGLGVRAEILLARGEVEAGLRLWRRAGDLPERLSAMLMHPVANPPPYLMELPVSGALLLALAMVDLDRGATGSGVRLVALAERLGFLRNFQPTMSAARARRAAEQADRPAYEDAVSSYAGLGHEELRAAALAALRARERP
jgi:tetratricopeptide (TPR) repeat protein